jgi:hypothetical protein
MSSNISMKNADAACWITILREQKANALLPEDCTAIRLYVEDAATRESVKAIVFTGSGKRAFFGWHGRLCIPGNRCLIRTCILRTAERYAQCGSHRTTAHNRPDKRRLHWRWNRLPLRCSAAMGEDDSMVALFRERRDASRAALFVCGCAGQVEGRHLRSSTASNGGHAPVDEVAS